MIDPSQLEDSVNLAIEKELLNRLQEIYDGIPEGQCTGCARCCSESVNAFYIEFINVWNHCMQQPNLLDKIMRKVYRYYFLELVQAQSCPFLDENNQCMVYAVRPLVCREFGHWSIKDFNANIKVVQQANKEVARYYHEEFGIELPQAAIERTIPYCDGFKVERKLSKAQRLEQADDIFTLDIPFLQTELLDEELMGTGLVGWFVYTQMSSEDAGEMRIKITREWLETGHSKSLEKLIESL